MQLFRSKRLASVNKTTSMKCYKPVRIGTRDISLNPFIKSPLGDLGVKIETIARLTLIKESLLF